MSVLGPDSPLFKKEPSRRQQWITHHPLFVPTIILMIIPIQEIVYHISSAWQWVAFILGQDISILIFFEVLASLKHMRGFCEYCFHQPAGGPETAQKHMRQLRIHHLRASVSRRLYITIILVMWVPMFLLRSWANDVYVIAFFFLFGFLDKASQVHAWLVPWCPWCKDDGRWVEPSPTPDPSMTKVHS